MRSEKDCILNGFWTVFCILGKEEATAYLNEHIGLSVPTFLKFKQTKKNDAYICIGIDLVKPYHIKGLMKGWPSGRNNRDVAGIWCRIFQESEKATRELNITNECTIEFVQVDLYEETTGYIFLDYT